jgi:hypothetical protein
MEEGLVRFGLFTALSLSLAASWLGACSSELGKCDDREAARQIVYGPNGSVATKGQALMHESCGQAAFCHSSAAKETQRKGAPHGMNFDMLPSPKGLAEVLDRADSIWDQVDDGQMPPKSYPLGDALWTYSPAHSMDEPHMPKLPSREAKGILRNWLACGAPVVTDSRVPDWAEAQAVEASWDSIYALFSNSCALAGCHDAKSATVSGHLDLSDKCAAYNALQMSGTCGMTRLTPGDADASFLVTKLEKDQPGCGSRMPTGGVFKQNQLDAIRMWIQDGAQAPGCE